MSVKSYYYRKRRGVELGRVPLHQDPGFSGDRRNPPPAVDLRPEPILLAQSGTGPALRWTSHAAWGVQEERRLRCRDWKSVLPRVLLAPFRGGWVCILTVRQERLLHPAPPSAVTGVQGTRSGLNLLGPPASEADTNALGVVGRGSEPPLPFLTKASRNEARVPLL